MYYTKIEIEENCLLEVLSSEELTQLNEMGYVGTPPTFCAVCGRPTTDYTCSTACENTVAQQLHDCGM